MSTIVLNTSWIRQISLRLFIDRSQYPLFQKTNEIVLWWSVWTVFLISLYFICMCLNIPIHVFFIIICCLYFMFYYWCLTLFFCSFLVVVYVRCSTRSMWLSRIKSFSAFLCCSIPSGSLSEKGYQRGNQIWRTFRWMQLPRLTYSNFVMRHLMMMI